jgi:folylpolyglutamate synthase/dihydropteroate synthase
VFGTVGDKDPSEVLLLIPANSTMYWCAADIHRAMPTKRLQEYGEGANLSGSTYGSVLEATIAARTVTLNDESSQAVICGSVFVVGEVI